MDLIHKLEPLALLLLIVVALNWAIDAVFGTNLVNEVLSSNTAEDVLYIAAGIGALMATAMKYRGFAGAVIDASVRDTPQIRKLQFPVFSRGVAPSTTINHYRVTGVNVPVTCAGIRVNPGDIITADEDGVAVVPIARAADVLKKSQELDDTEHRMLPFIEKFRSIREAVKQFGRI